MTMPRPDDEAARRRGRRPAGSLGGQCRVPAGHPAGRLAGGRHRRRSTTRPPGCWAIPQQIDLLPSSGKARATSTWTPSSTSPVATCSEQGGGRTCRPHGFTGPLAADHAARLQPRSSGADRFVMVEDCQRAAVRRSRCRRRRGPARLPVLQRRQSLRRRPRAGRPTTPARSRLLPGPAGRDHVHQRRSAAWRRWCARGARRISARSSGRATYSLEAEMISACGYLDDDGVACSLHGRHRADGRPPSRISASNGPRRTGVSTRAASSGPGGGGRPDA